VNASLRILFISNFYPPYQPGWGYMQLCEEVAEGLSRRGHDLAVLTSAHRDGPEIVRDYPVWRRIHLDPDWQIRRPAYWQFFAGRLRRERLSLAAFRQVTAEFAPQAIIAWNAYGIPRRLLAEAESLPGLRMAYYLANYLPEDSDEYLAYWRSMPQSRVGQILKRIPAAFALRQLAREGKALQLSYEHCACVSAYLRSRLVGKGLIPASSVVIYNGVDLNQFKPRRQKFCGSPVRMLVAGRLSAEKGVHTVIQALVILKHQGSLQDCRLTLLGDGPPDYLADLRQTIREHELEQIVTFIAPIPRAEMPQVLDQHDILILPSIYAEPLARAAQEAMAMGLLVISTDTGGSCELLVDGEAGFVFHAGDPESLAERISRASASPNHMLGIAEIGRIKVSNDFNIEKTVSDIEAFC
jgi:glycosyltransferase involved in cell wall biosynthesis